MLLSLFNGPSNNSENAGNALARLTSVLSQVVNLVPWRSLLMGGAIFEDAAHFLVKLSLPPR